MKSQFLKIAGVKSEKAFYKKYPTEAAFFKAHPEAKKMANGGEQDKGQIKKLQQLTDFGNPPMAQFGMNLPDPFSFGQINPNLNTQGLTGLGAQQPTDFGKYVAGMGQSKRAAANTYGQMFGNFQTGKDLSTGIPNPLGSADKLKGTDIFGKIDKAAGKAAPYVGYAKDIIGGIGMIKQEKNALKQAKQDKALTDVFRQAAFSSPMDIEKRQYVRPEDIIFQPEQLFPSYGVGTNVLAKDGIMVGGNPTEIANTFAPNTIYSDMGYEPLDDTNQIKSYYTGGKLTQAGAGLTTALNSGGFGDFMTNQGGGDFLENISSRVSGKHGPNAGNKIGGGIGGGIGTAIGGPVGGMIGKFAGNLLGGLFDKTGKKIDTLNQQSDQNVSDIIYSKAGVGLQNQYGSYMEDGGEIDDEHAWVSNSWQPQVIATFGEHKLEDLLQPPNDADMLRAGGHLRNYTPPSEEAMYTGREQFAMGGDLQVYRGEAETMSHNPYLPEGGETVMFRGPSHENGGMPIKFGSSPVEVEGGEPAVKLEDGGTGENSMVVFGNLHIPNQFVNELDSKAKGQKFKNYVADLSKNEAKQNKIIDKSSNQLDGLTPLTSFDQLELSALQANLMGANMKLKDIAEKKQTAAALQSAINDTAEEHGLVAEHLAKGKAILDKSKDGKAKNGKNVLKAATGADINPTIDSLINLIKQKGYDYNVTSTIRPGAKTAQGRKSRHASGEAADITFPKLGAGAYEAILNDPEIAQFMLDNDLTAINEYDPSTLAATKGTGPHIHFGFDRGTQAADKFREQASSLYAQPGTTAPSIPAQGSSVNFEDYQYLKGLYDAAKKQKKGPAVEKFQKEYSRIAPNFAQQVLGQYPVTSYGKAKGLKPTDISSNFDAIFGPRTERYMASLNISPVKGVGITNQGLPSTTPIIPLPNITETTKGGIETPQPKFPWMDMVNTIIGQVRPSDAERLDTNQILGEIYAMNNNQIEPVYFQKYTPQLANPSDISFQDKLNEVTSTFNNARRLAAGDASALANIAAQESQIKTGILGEQFRANQGQKQQVYNANIDTMNRANLANLSGLAQQQELQSKAKSATKATTQAALNSISNKFAQNKLDNRTLATYENLYNYRYDPSFRAQNMNPLFNPNIPQVGTTANKTAEGKDLLPIYDTKGGITGYKVKQDATTKSKAKNGSIVKAIKNL